MRNYRLEREIRKAEILPVNPIKSAIDGLYPPTAMNPMTAQEVIQRMVKKKASRKSEWIESPYFPGILFKKTPMHLWMEEKKAEIWEDAYDYIHRVYRLEQQTPAQIIKEWGVGKFLVTRLIRSVGEPPLRSNEYHDPHRAATARRWEDESKRKLIQDNLKKSWDEDKSDRVAMTHSKGAKELRRSSIQQARERNGSGKSSREFSKMVSEQKEAKAREKLEVLGSDAKAVLHELLEVKGLGYSACAVALKKQVSVDTIRRWAIEEEIQGRPRTSHGGLKASQYEKYEAVFGKKICWEHLTDKQREVLALIKDETGKYRQNQEIARIVGMTSAGVHYTIQRAIQRLSELDK
jgi:hypothetical protein